jgi:glutamate racemase
MIATNDYLVLGCSHYVDSADKKILPEHIKIIDSGGPPQTKYDETKVGFSTAENQMTNFFMQNTNRP